MSEKEEKIADEIKDSEEFKAMMLESLLIEKEKYINEQNKEEEKSERADDVHEIQDQGEENSEEINCKVGSKKDVCLDVLQAVVIVTNRLRSIKKMLSDQGISIPIVNLRKNDCIEIKVWNPLNYALILHDAEIFEPDFFTANNKSITYWQPSPLFGPSCFTAYQSDLNDVISFLRKLNYL